MDWRGKTPGLDPRLYTYLVEHGSPPDAVLSDLIAETEATLPDQAVMQIAPEQGAFLEFFTAVTGARRAVEVGTFTGYSALCIARGLPGGGQLLCCDVSEEYTAIARRYWRRAGVDDRIDLRLGDANETLSALPQDRWIDLAFIDADKPAYPRYYEALLARLAPLGVIIVDNVLSSGRVLDPDEAGENARAIAAFNDLVAADDRVHAVMVPIGDGLTFIRRRPTAPGGRIDDGRGG